MVALFFMRQFAVHRLDLRKHSYIFIIAVR